MFCFFICKFRVTFKSGPRQVLKDIEAAKYIHGIAVHWYLDGLVPARVTLGATHHIFPEYYLFGTEACSGWNPLDRGVKLGSWLRAESYAHDIIGVSSSRLLRRAHVNPVERMCDFKVDHPPPLNPTPPTLQCRSPGSSSLPTLFLGKLACGTVKQAEACVFRSLSLCALAFLV